MFRKKNVVGNLNPQILEPSIELLIFYANNNTATFYRSVKWEKASRE
jgi:hypothetical protein